MKIKIDMGLKGLQNYQSLLVFFVYTINDFYFNI